MKTIIVYGSMTGVTETVAEDMATAFGGTAIAAGDADAEALEGCELLILGASTWGMGDLQDDMADFLSRLPGLNVSATVGAVFGTGDQFGYTDTYVDGIDDMAKALVAKGIKHVGHWPVDDYAFTASRAQEGDVFSGLALDLDNESEKTAARIIAWSIQVKAEAGA